MLTTPYLFGVAIKFAPLYVYEDLVVERWEGHAGERGVWHVLGDHGTNFGLCGCLLFLNVLLAHVAKRAVVLITRTNC